MIGIVAALFCTFVVAGLSSYCFQMDWAWYAALKKPSFVLGGGYMTAFVFLSYISVVLSISRLVEYRHFFPSLLYFLLLGAGSVLFVTSFFKFKSPLGGFLTMTATLAMSYTIFIRFLIKDIKNALEFLPAFLFHIYAFLCTISILMLN